MGGIEILAVAVIFILGAIGLVRGPSKELGVTMALVVLLAIMSQFDSLVSLNEMPARVNDVMAGLGFGSAEVTTQRMMVLFVYSGVMIFTAFLAYHGQDTLAFRFKDPSGLPGVILGWLAGALNGYLIFGTIWYYLEQLEYPIQRYEWFTAQFTSLANNMATLLPQKVASGTVLSALALVLLWWRILK